MKISVYIATSLDGFIARKDGSLDWLPGSDGEVDESLVGEDFGYATFMDSVDVMVMGRKSYEKILSFGEWPYGDKRVIVLSSTLKTVSPTIASASFVSIRDLSPEALVEALRSEGADHLYIDGGSTIQRFINANLVDELILTRVPILIGEGISLFGTLHKDKTLEHQETQSYSNGFVQSRYKIV